MLSKQQVADLQSQITDAVKGVLAKNDTHFVSARCTYDPNTGSMKFTYETLNPQQDSTAITTDDAIIKFGLAPVGSKIFVKWPNTNKWHEGQIRKIGRKYYVAYFECHKNMFRIPFDKAYSSPQTT